MKASRPGIWCSALALLAAGCATVDQADYTLYREHEPRSILVLPPLNQTVEVQADYNWLSTASLPLAERGFYVFPVAVVDAFMKENGLPSAAEMHQVEAGRLRETFGADAVLYVTITEWGQKFVLFSSNTVVAARANLVDTATETVIWTGEVRLIEGSGGSGDALVDLFSAIIEQVIDSTSDQAHLLARRANFWLFFNEGRGLPPGHRSPLHGTAASGT